MKMIECNGRMYTYDGKYFFDENFIIVEGAELKEVAGQYFSTIPYDILTTDELISLVIRMKGMGLYFETKKIIQFAMEQRGDNLGLMRTLLPIYLSCCREANQPQSAIDCAMKWLPICGGSNATYTSLAAAYCDIKDYENAKKYARIAYAKQGGGQGYTTETSLVFKRIQKETGEEYFSAEEENSVLKDSPLRKKEGVAPLVSMKIVEPAERELPKCFDVSTKDFNDWEILEKVANGLNPFTGEVIEGIDEDLKRKLEDISRKLQGKPFCK
jgi:hypothetical protein